MDAIFITSTWFIETAPIPEWLHLPLHKFPGIEEKVYPPDLAGLLKLKKECVRLTYEIKPLGKPRMGDILVKFLNRHQLFKGNEISRPIRRPALREHGQGSFTIAYSLFRYAMRYLA